jgi:hypothetical protein
MWLLGMVEATIEDLGIPAVLRGYLTQSDGDVVLSTTLPRDTSCGQAGEQRIKEKRWVFRCGVKNLHLSKTIPKS